jgi:hypothetical protein
LAECVENSKQKKARKRREKKKASKIRSIEQAGTDRIPSVPDPSSAVLNTPEKRQKLISEAGFNPESTALLSSAQVVFLFYFPFFGINSLIFK